MLKNKYKNFIKEVLSFQGLYGSIVVTEGKEWCL